MNGNRLMFAAMCLIWGTTWIAIKVGVEAVPPIFFAGSRFVAAGLLMLAWHRLRGGSIALPGRDWPRQVRLAVLMIVATYGFLFWGMQHVASGLSAVVNLALIPIALLAIGLAYGAERYSPRRAASVALGVLGLAVLFEPAGASRIDPLEPWGMAAIVAGTLAYCWGSVLGRPLVRAHGPLLVGGLSTLIGGPMLIALALVIEPLDRELLTAFARPEVFAAWLFLVLFGSLVAFTIYLRLLRDWGPLSAGMYAFVSPVIAVALGALVFAEAFGPVEALGSLLMLGAARLALARSASPSAEAAPSPRSGCAGARRRGCR
jgi:drug/metabolite transporter (DMT)-like permease